MGRGRVALAWAVLLLAVLTAHVLTRDAHALLRMVALIFAGLFGMKLVVLAGAAPRSGAPLTGLALFAFVFGWVGMNPAAFGKRQPAPARARSLLTRASVFVLVGLALIVAGRFVWQQTHSTMATAVLTLPGLSFVLHFGLVNALAGFWSAVGFRTDRQFVAPLRSKSLAEFWGRRWNLAFRDMTSRTIYRPVKARAGVAAGLLASFVVSGLLHEMAISAPVMQGFGMPLAYFAIHAVGMLLERRLTLRGWVGWLWTTGWVVVPLPLLFHLPFLHGVVWPLTGLSAP